MPARTIFQIIYTIFCSNSAVGLLAFGVLAPPALAAPTETVLHSFGMVPNGNNPQAPLLASGDGGFYGTTANGGAGGVGTVFKMIRPGKGGTVWQHIVLYSFRNDGSDGGNPYASVIADKSGALYGTTNVGGTAGVGTVYKLAPPAHGGTDWTETVLYSFKNDGIDGGAPEAPLILDTTGALYGTTTGGLSNKGTAFKLTPPGTKQTSWTETVIYPIGNSFGALVEGKHGTLYGTTSGLSTNDGGSVFKLTPPAKGATAWTLSTLHNFTGIGADYAGGYSPGAGLIIDASGTLYGTTIFAYSPDLGSTAGTVFSLTPPARGGMWKFSQLGFRLSPIFAPVIADASGNLYGTDSVTISGKTYGEVFKLTRPASDKAAWTLSSIYTTGDNLVSALAADATGALYGTAANGGDDATGAVFKLTPPASGHQAWAGSVIYKFDSSTDGLPNSLPEVTFPLAALFADPSGAMFGTTPAGGLYDKGIAFKLTPPTVSNDAWTETILHSFGASKADGINPATALIAGANGTFYGATATGAPHRHGSVFELEPPTEGKTEWTEKIISGFGSVSNLVAGKSGALYGTSLDDDSAHPRVFVLAPPSSSSRAWTEKVVYQFRGAQQYAGAFLSSDPSGALYEMLPTSSNSGGTTFKLTPPQAGETVWTGTEIYSFSGMESSGGTGGWGLYSPVLFGKDGVLFGTTACGGSHASNISCGTVFSLTPPAAGKAAWTETDLHNFGHQGDGAEPVAGLISDASGTLYGTTSVGGGAKGYENCPSGCGTVFKLTPPASGHMVWTETRLYDFKGESDGAYPASTLIIDANGNLYGTATSGGNGAAGVVFKITP